MSLAAIAVGYVGLGAIFGIVCATIKRTSFTDTFLVVVMWPIYAPFLLAGDHRERDSREAELLDALARAASSPLAAMLPDAESARVLARRLREADARLVELETVLARPDFDPDATERHAKALEARGASAAAATALMRVRTLGQLRALRLRYRHELDEVGELIAQLVTQAELVRLEPNAGSTDLVKELIERIEDLGDLFAAHSAIEEQCSIDRYARSS